LLELAAKSVEAKLAPLGAIDDYRALLKDADLEYIRGEIPLAIQQSRDGVAQIKKIVLAMKEFSHPSADEKEPVDLNRAIEATVMVARNEWKYVAEVELNLDASIPVIEAVPSAVNQVVLNLVVNAAHARSARKKGRDGGAFVNSRSRTRAAAFGGGRGAHLRPVNDEEDQ
jgi:nitrogen-specific signal transduction histidine kinase